MSAPSPDWNDPRSTWKLASYLPPTPPPAERRLRADRRTEPRRATLGERRTSMRRSLRSLLRL
ncbi:MAG: hypothetical protein AB8I08_29880 [Sandaracinaceae bacterium]